MDVDIVHTWWLPWEKIDGLYFLEVKNCLYFGMLIINDDAQNDS